MVKVIDLTQKQIGTTPQRNSISLSQAKKTNQAGIPNYLQQVEIGQGIDGLYFTEGVPSDYDDCYYDLAWLKIPAEFQYVNYGITTGHDVTFTQDDIKPQLTSSILSPLLLLHDSSDVPQDPHFCATKPGFIKGSTESCTNTLVNRIANFQGVSPDQNTRTFELFYYKGELRIATHYLKSGYKRLDKTVSLAEYVRGEYLLIPLITSERYVVYYAITITLSESSSYLPQLTKLHKDIIGLTTGKPSSYVETTAAFIPNDDLGIFITREIEVI